MAVSNDEVPIEHRLDGNFALGAFTIICVLVIRYFVLIENIRSNARKFT